MVLIIHSNVIGLVETMRYVTACKKREGIKKSTDLGRQAASQQEGEGTRLVLEQEEETKKATNDAAAWRKQCVHLVLQ